jgi:glycerate-2-kinase
MKGGRISRHFRPARVIHLLITDPVSFTVRIYGNVWLHTLPDTTGFQDAVSLLKKWEVWEEVPASVRRHLERADPEMETVKPAEFLQMGSRIFALMPPHLTKLPAAMNKAQELGFKPVLLARELHDIEASQAALYLTAVARTVERTGQPAEPPCALFASGEMVVTVGKHKGIGGRNQEMVLASAMEISGSRNILIGSVDTDGTDGPGDQFVEGYGDIPCLAGGIVDGTTLAESRAAGIDIAEELRRHNTSPPLRKLNSGIVASPNVSLVDLTVALVMGRNED